MEITDKISILHNQSKQKHYVEIYFIFKNFLISKLIYKSYKKNKFKRFCYYLFCRCRKIRKYYYKNQWLNFEFANTCPSDIKWENCYTSTVTKKKEIFKSLLISSFIIIITTSIIIILTSFKNDNKIVKNTLIVFICQIINITSSSLLKKLTKSEKYSTLNKNNSSNITKYFWLNFIISVISINIKYIFTYKKFKEFSQNIECVIISMILSIFTAHASILFFYLWDFLQRYSDSKFENGRTI